MTVQELIAELNKCSKNAQVYFFFDWDSKREVIDVSPEDSDGHVVLGESLPPELYARDYKYD
ncbi:MAG TPA: hypothetical protein VM619_14565 [Luteimonas sp.]|nr:hypothetical protein [Luteimonas sp.]